MSEHHSIETALRALEAAPLSRRRAMLLALLIDAEIEARFALSGESDILAFRERLVEGAPTLAPVLHLAAMQPDGPALIVEPVEIAITDYARLEEADYMVSLYNKNTIPRLFVALPDGGRRDALEMLRQALVELAG